MPLCSVNSYFTASSACSKHAAENIYYNFYILVHFLCPFLSLECKTPYWVKFLYKKHENFPPNYVRFHRGHFCPTLVISGCDPLSLFPFPKPPFYLSSFSFWLQSMDPYSARRSHRATPAAAVKGSLHTALLINDTWNVSTWQPGQLGTATAVTQKNTYFPNSCQYYVANTILVFW